MRFKKILAVVVAAASGAALASGPFDGIYRYGNTNDFISIHQNGSNIIGGFFTTIPATNIIFSLGDGQSFPPTRVDQWDLYTGPIAGNVAIVTGEIAYGACKATLRVTFNNGSFTAERRFIDTTPLGFNRGIDCPRYQRHIVNIQGITTFWTKVF